MTQGSRTEDQSESDGTMPPDPKGRRASSLLYRLFKPGQGAVPPYLAGRKQEQATFHAFVKSLKNGRPPSRDLILYGPRGNGKTALLRYLQTKTRQQGGSSLGVLWATPRELANPGKLVDLIIGDYATLRSKLQSAGFSFHFGIAKAETQIDLSKRPLTLGDLLQERCQHQPLILIIDEAHRLDPQMGEDLLNASQNARAGGCPFLLVLAGTPNLEVTLRKANVSFWDRSKIIRLGQLSSEEASQALTVPLQKAGITFAPMEWTPPLFCFIIVRQVPEDRRFRVFRLKNITYERPSP